MTDKYHCSICGEIESQCKCDVRDYCILCQDSHDVRLCEDGLYYCRTCREACDYQAQY
jgi:hypothetical protein